MSDALVKAMFSGTYCNLPGSEQRVYSTICVLCTHGPRTLNIDTIARVTGLSERHTRTAIDALLDKKLLQLTPITNEHRHRFSGRYELPTVEEKKAAS